MLSVVVIFASLQLDTSPPMIVGDSMQPRVFPIFLMGLSLALVCVLVWQLRTQEPPDIEPAPFATWGSMALMLVFFGLTEWLDLFIAIPVVMFCMCVMWGERRLWVAGLVATITPLTVFVLFDEVLRVRFPRGVLIDLYYG